MALPTVTGSRSGLYFNLNPGGLPSISDAKTYAGNIFFVMTGGTDAAGYGLHPDAPFATIDYAIGRCTASQGDVIFVMPGYTQTLTAAAGIDADIAGISINGLGNGANKPEITLGTVDTTDIDIDAANITFRNLRFVNAIDSNLGMLDVNADRFTCEDCDFVSSSTKEALLFVSLATTKDFLTFRRCTFIQPTDPGGSDGAAETGCIYFEDSEHILFEDCSFIGNFESAIFHNKSTAAKYVFIKRCHGVQELSGAEVFIQVAAMSGGIMGSLFTVTNAADVTETTVTGTLSVNFFVNVDSGFGNDGAGGQLAVAVATAAT